MDALIVLGCLVLIPAVATLLLRSNGMLVFLSVGLGSLLATYVSGDASEVIAGASRSGALATMQWTQIALLTLPVVFTIALTRKKMKAIKLLLGVTASLAAGALLALLATPYLSSSLQTAIRKTEIWHQLYNLETPIILTGASITILLLFITRAKPDKDKKHK